MMTKHHVSAFLVAIGALLLPPVSEAVTISFNPLATVVVEGDSFGVDIRVSGLERSGLDEIVAGFDLDVFFRDSILTATGFDFGTELGPADFSGSAISAGYVDLYQFSFFPDDAALAAAQGNTVVLGRLNFTAMSAGVTLLSFGQDPLFGRNVVGRDGLTLTPLFAVPAITVVSRGAVSVPEPPTFALLGFGLVLLALRGSTARLSSIAIRSPRS